MGIQLKNNASGTLATAVNASDTGIVLTTGNGASFPALGAGDYFYATLESTGGTSEIIKVTVRSGDSLTVVRAQEGTTAQSFAAGSRIELRVTAQSVLDAVDQVTAAQVSVTPYGWIAATNVQAAFEEIVDELDAQQVSYTPPFTGSVPTNVEAKLAQTVSVTDFGAVGDGVVDDTAAIQAAINSGAGAVYFPQGTYYTTGTVSIASSGVVLFADDPTTAVIKGNGTNILFSLATTSIAARNLGFDTCLRAFNSSESHIDADNFVFVGCRFTNITLRAITYYDSVNDINGFVCKDCYFEDVGTGVYLNGKTYVKNIQITGNTFIDVAGDQALSGAIFVEAADQGLLTNYKQSYSIVVSNNTIESVHGVYSGPDSYTLAFGIFVGASGAVIANNTIKDVRTTNGNASISPIGIYTKCVDSIIDANILIDAGEKFAIYSVGSSFDQGPFANGVAGNNIITDNIITYDAVTPTSDVCILTQSNHVTISDNRLYGNTATILAYDAAGASVSTGRSITGNSLVSNSLIKIATVGSNVSVSNNYLEYTGAAEMRTCGAGSTLQVFNTSCMHCGDFPGATVSKTIRSVVVNGNVLHSRSFVTTKTGVLFSGSSASTTTFDTISVNGNNFYNFFNPIIFGNLDFANVQCSSNIGTNASGTYFGLNGLAARYTNFHKNNNVGTGTKLSNAISQISPNGTLYYIKTDNAGARTFSTDILA